KQLPGMRRRPHGRSRTKGIDQFSHDVAQESGIDGINPHHQASHHAGECLVLLKDLLVGHGGSSRVHWPMADICLYRTRRDSLASPLGSFRQSIIAPLGPHTADYAVDEPPSSAYTWPPGPDRG